ncbi:MAG: cell wall metabolism sensor histidine kinase WalK [Firmicutes bacterium]|nr:cell wall metabolism sensor histidine kinase WalK [Bacillota bacterium]
MHKPLLLKLTGLVLVVTFLSIGVTTFFVAQSAKNTLIDNLKLDLVTDTELVDFLLTDVNFDQLDQKVTDLGKQIDRRITIISKQGIVLADSHEKQLIGADYAQKPEFSQAIADGVGIDLRISQFTGEETLYLAIPSAKLGVIRLAVASSAVTQDIAKLYQGTIPLLVLVGLAAFGIVYLVTRNITQPIQDMLLVTKKLQQGEFGRRVLVKSRDEIGLLGRSFNELSLTLEKMFDTIYDRESKLNAVLTSMNDSVLALNVNQRVILANRAVGELLRVNEASLIGRHVGEIIKSEDFSEIIQETITYMKSIDGEIQLSPGSSRIIAVRCSPLQDEDGDIMGVVVVLRDITKLRRLENMRKEFVANVSHELRTPLTSIKGFVETILDGNTNDPQLVERFLTIVNGETDRMISLINDLLDLSRIESGKQFINLEAVNIREVFDSTILALQSKTLEKNITVDNEIEDLQVIGDIKLLQQVTTNLVDNAIKYNQEGGRVWLTSKVMDDEVEITVCDTGMGIAENHLDRIFERFYRVDRGRSRQMGGTGLGLSIVKHIIEKHQGRIYAESKVGEGTQIKFTLKLAKENEQENN